MAIVCEIAVGAVILIVMTHDPVDGNDWGIASSHKHADSGGDVENTGKKSPQPHANSNGSGGPYYRLLAADSSGSNACLSFIVLLRVVGVFVTIIIVIIMPIAVGVTIPNYTVMIVPLWLKKESLSLWKYQLELLSFVYQHNGSKGAALFFILYIMYVVVSVTM